MTHLLDRRTREEIAPEGMTYLSVDEDTSMRILQDLTVPDTRSKVLAWLHASETVLKLHTGTSHFPEAFRRELRAIPNRDTNHIEDTHGQATQLMPGREYRSKLAMLLAEGGHAVSDVLRLIPNGIDGVHQSGKTFDVGTLGITTLRMASKANAEHQWEALLEDMRTITKVGEHMTQQWNDPAADGTVLLIPESAIMHRRDGEKTAQVVWHTDTLGGTIIFCKEHGEDRPKRILFSELGTQEL